MRSLQRKINATSLAWNIVTRPWIFIHVSYFHYWRDVHVRTWGVALVLKVLLIRFIGVNIHIKFKLNWVSKFWDIQEGCIRAHVVLDPRCNQHYLVLRPARIYAINFIMIWFIVPKLQRGEKTDHPFSIYPIGLMLNQVDLHYLAHSIRAPAAEFGPVQISRN